MKNYKKTGWIEEIQNQLNDKLSTRLYYAVVYFYYSNA